jgi:hypothetical protein
MTDFLNPRGVPFHGVLQDPNCLPCHNQVSWVRGSRARDLKRGLP